MHALRTTTLLARFVLAWFVLTLGIAVASPLVHPQSVELVCTDTGRMKLVVHDENGAVDASHHTLDCPMCLGATLPPPMQVRGDLPQPLAHALLPVVKARIAATVGAPLPPRGPPAHA